MAAKQDRIEKNWLPRTFWAIPATANTTMTAKELRETVLATNGTIIAAGKIWEVVHKRIAPGVYRVSLKLDAGFR